MSILDMFLERPAQRAKRERKKEKKKYHSPREAGVEVR